VGFYFFLFVKLDIYIIFLVVGLHDSSNPNYRVRVTISGKLNLWNWSALPACGRLCPLQRHPALRIPWMLSANSRDFQSVCIHSAPSTIPFCATAVDVERRHGTLPEMPTTARMKYGNDTEMHP
jgi:hypothetical protein